MKIMFYMDFVMIFAGLFDPMLAIISAIEKERF